MRDREECCEQPGSGVESANKAGRPAPTQNHAGDSPTSIMLTVMASRPGSASCRRQHRRRHDAQGSAPRRRAGAPRDSAEYKDGTARWVMPARRGWGPRGSSRTAPGSARKAPTAGDKTLLPTQPLGLVAEKAGDERQQGRDRREQDNPESAEKSAGYPGSPQRRRGHGVRAGWRQDDRPADRPVLAVREEGLHLALAPLPTRRDERLEAGLGPCARPVGRPPRAGRRRWPRRHPSCSSLVVPGEGDVLPVGA